MESGQMNENEALELKTSINLTNEIIDSSSLESDFTLNEALIQLIQYLKAAETKFKIFFEQSEEKDENMMNEYLNLNDDLNLTLKRIDDIENYKIPRPFIKELDSIYDAHYSSAKKKENLEEFIFEEGEYNFPLIPPYNKIDEFSLNQHLDLDDLQNYDLKENEIEKDSNDLYEFPYGDYGVNKKIKKNKTSIFFLKKKVKKNELASPFMNLEKKEKGEEIVKDLDETVDEIIKIDEDSSESKYVEVLKEFKVRSANLINELNDDPSKKNSNNLAELNLSSNHEINMVRLASEFKMLRRELPVFFTNSIFLVHDEKLFNKIKFLIIGAENTPYANGAFIFNLEIPANYPQIPPKCEIVTGRGNVRFNPNLYQEGKVCLSLLGTWAGRNCEKWDPNQSNIFQILLSLQSLVMTKNVLINEPGYSTFKSRNGSKVNRGYCNIIKYANINYAMIDYLKNPPECFKNVILNHFFYKKNRILEVCNKWLERASKKCSYGELNNVHNSKWSKLFSSGEKLYNEFLEKSIHELKYLLENLKLPE